MTRSSSVWLMIEFRDRIAELLYGDGDELPWARCVELADLIFWELNHE